MCNSLIGFNFGDGHLHNAEMVLAVQREAAFERGECVVAWLPNGPIPLEVGWSVSGSRPNHGALA